MHRVAAILLVAVFSFSLITPALPSDTASNLPECCRRDGAHHCALQMGSDTSNGVNLIAPKCPQFPTVPLLQMHGHPGLFSTSSLQTGELLAAYVAEQARLEAVYRISYSRTSQKRGPPDLKA